MPKDNGHAVLGTEVSAPLPRHPACDGPDETIPGGCQSLEERVGTGCPLAVKPYLAILWPDTDVHGAGMPVDATGKLRLVGGASPAVSSSPSEPFSHDHHTTAVGCGGGLNKYQALASDAP